MAKWWGCEIGSNGQDEGVQLNFDLSLLDENKGKSLHKFLLICKAAHMQLRNVGNY